MEKDIRISDGTGKEDIDYSALHKDVSTAFIGKTNERSPTVLMTQVHGRQAAEPGTGFRMLGRRQCREDQMIMKVLSITHGPPSMGK